MDHARVIDALAAAGCEIDQVSLPLQSVSLRNEIRLETDTAA